MTRVLHTGDTHIGYRQYHSPERRADFLAAFRRVVEDAIEDDVDAVVHAGDLFHDRRPDLPDIHGTIEILRELRDAAIPLFAVVGNHERTRGEQWLDLFETLGLATRLGRAPDVVGDVALYGLDFVPRSRRDALDYDFESHDADHAALVAHGLFEPFAHADWDTEAVLEASTVDFDALLLGDNHDPGVEIVDDTWVTYCGSTERVDASERADRGYNLVTFDDGVNVARRGIETRPFVTVDLELAPGEGADRVRARLDEEPLEDAVVVVTLSGDGEPVSAAEVETFATEGGALVARVTDRREFEAAEVEAVRFVDPDQAVEKRLRDLGLSDAALAIDGVVRDGDVPKTNVRDRVEEHVREVLEEDPDAFEPADSARPRPEPVADPPVADEAAATATGDPAGASNEAAEPPSSEAGSTAATEDPGETDTRAPEGVASTDGEVDPGADEAGGSAPRSDGSTDDADRQLTMENYL
ncbi:MAG: DNA double-strand break repair protein Mre11 [Halobacteriales archaeon]